MAGEGARGSVKEERNSGYQVWLDKGNGGPEVDFLSSLIGATGTAGTTGATGLTGADGIDGIDGADGISAYQVWLNNGNVGPEVDFLSSLIVSPVPTGRSRRFDLSGAEGSEEIYGKNGISAYQVWLNTVTVAPKENFLSSLFLSL